MELLVACERAILRIEVEYLGKRPRRVLGTWLCHDGLPGRRPDLFLSGESGRFIHFGVFPLLTAYYFFQGFIYINDVESVSLERQLNVITMTCAVPRCYQWVAACRSPQPEHLFTLLFTPTNDKCKITFSKSVQGYSMGFSHFRLNCVQGRR